jgi:hypothetical protein
VRESYFAKLGVPVADKLSPSISEKLEEVESKTYYKMVDQDSPGLRVPDDLDESICRYQSLSPTLRAKFDRATYWLSMASRQWDDSMSASYASLVSSAEALTVKGTKHSVYCDECEEKRSHDVPGATQNFRDLFEKYAPGTGLKENRSKMYRTRSDILHGSDLMQIDQDRAVAADPPWSNELEMHTELWTLMRITARNWLMDPPEEAFNSAEETAED